ncbi:NAD(P)-dependent alcohol dehydrogenase [Nocardia gipuzkoensis]|uniref:NAD(P)-dependent alcohol dehydrogenase n=1 Tax=Nocardia gipuzkoensis TaxID=2749991 RepID=UPI001E405C1C|nr:NAD(P)-dependent alcohol dehydrogenase [Nocardia gipuzkoensis]UGT68359.1 NAD(P)-dependent alcohol dehydrogenase [Nocardia gipuzkoensis]
MSTWANAITPDASGGDRSPTMRAIVQRGYGPPEQVLALDHIARPTPGDDDVLIRMRASSVNTPDWLAVTGVPYLLRLQFGIAGPSTPVRGSDVAGIVQTVGKNVTDFRPGDEVFGSLWDNSVKSSVGTFAEYTVAPASQLITKPTSLSFEEAAAAVMSGITALLAIRDVGRAGPGKRVLINGASGGVGTFAVQIAKTLGAHVTGVCSTRNAEFVQSLGADEIIDYTRTDYTRSTQRYDVILDNVLNHPPATTAQLLTAGGTFIPNSVGPAHGLFGSLPRIARAMTMRWGPTDVRTATSFPTRENLDDLAALLVSGDVKVIVEKSYPLTEVAHAVAHMLAHHARGNIVIIM